MVGISIKPDYGNWWLYCKYMIQIIFEIIQRRGNIVISNIIKESWISQMNHYNSNNHVSNDCCKYFHRIFWPVIELTSFQLSKSTLLSLQISHMTIQLTNSIYSIRIFLEKLFWFVILLLEILIKWIEKNRGKIWAFSYDYVKIIWYSCGKELCSVRAT